MKNRAAYYIAGILMAVWFVGFLFFNAPAEIHLVFLAGLLVLIIQLVLDFRNRE